MDRYDHIYIINEAASDSDISISKVCSTLSSGGICYMVHLFLIESSSNYYIEGFVNIPHGRAHPIMVMRLTLQFLYKVPN